MRTVLTSSYSGYYRRMLPKLLAAIEFKCNNTAYRPVMDALELLRRYAGIPNSVRHYDASEAVPVKGVVPDGWLEAVAGEDGIIERASYELCVIVSLKDAGAWPYTAAGLQGQAGSLTTAAVPLSLAPGIARQVEEHSEEVRPGVYQVRLGDARERDWIPLGLAFRPDEKTREPCWRTAWSRWRANDQPFDAGT